MFINKLIVFLSLSVAFSVNAQSPLLASSNIEESNKSTTNFGCADKQIKNSVIYYSTKPGKFAFDGVGRNGLYTGALIHELKTRNDSIDHILNKVSLHVVDESNGSQTPTSAGSLSNNCFSQLNFKDALKRYPNKFALVIGNSNYLSSSSLPNPINDSNDITEFFKEQGFEVLQINDMLRKDLKSINAKLKKRISKDSVFVFYYAGHAIQVGNESYFFPIDVNLDSHSKNDILKQSLSLRGIINTVNALKTNVNLYFIDANRDDPFR